MNCKECGQRMVDMSHQENSVYRHWRVCVNTLCPSKLHYHHTDERIDPETGQPYPYGRCDTCGEPCDEGGCILDREHVTAKE